MNRCLLNGPSLVLWRTGPGMRPCVCLQRRLSSFNSNGEPSNHNKTGERFHLESLNVKDLLKPVKKMESSVKLSFFGEIDKDYLKFPNLVGFKQQEELLTAQYDFIRRHFIQLCSNQSRQIECGLFDTKSMTVLEMAYMFEAIGASLNFRPSQDPSHHTDVSFLVNYGETKSFVQSILPLLVHNSLVTGAVNACANSTLKQKLSSQGKLNRPCIAFAWCEANDKFASMSHPFWESIATYNEEDDTWTISGSKRFIIKADYEDFVIFCKVQKPNPPSGASEDEIALFLVNRKQLQIEDDGSDNFGNQFLKISFKDLVLPREQQLYTTDSQGDCTNGANFALNIKARGQLAVSAILLGVMKQSFDNVISNYNSGKLTVSKSIMEEQMSQVTQMIYSLESALYITGSQFDSFDLNHNDLFLQGMLVKTLASEYCAQMLDTFRFLFDSTQLPQIMSTETSNVLNVLDSFLDSATSNRMLLAVYGLRSVGAWKFDHIAKMRLRAIYMYHFLKFSFLSKFRQKMLQRSPASNNEELKSLKSLHHSLEASTNLLTTALQEQLKIGQHILGTYGKECISYQIDMNRYASIAMSTFQMIVVITRTNHSLQEKGPHSQVELELCRRICEQEANKVTQNIRLINGILYTSEEMRSRAIHKRNMRCNGYFAKPTFDRII